jgi:hypothetical protein
LYVLRWSVAKKKNAAAAAIREEPEEAAAPQADALVQRHLRWGWWSIALFTLFGLFLEAGHGLKLGWYLDAGNATRRLSFTLGHAHGTLLGFANIAFALSFKHAKLSDVSASRASIALLAATVLMPLGFIAGGFGFYAGDPGLAIALVPPGALLLVVATLLIARGFRKR